MKKKELIYEGKAKKIYTTEDSDLLIAEFKDDLTAFNAEKKGSSQNKGYLNNKISESIFNLLSSKGIKTHLVKSINDTEQLIKKCKMIELEVVVRNIASGSLVKRLGLKDGEKLDFSLIEFYYKNDFLNDPIINDEHCLLLNLVKSQNDLDNLRLIARKINEILFIFFDEIDIKLVDFKIEFGIDKNGEIILADEISPDSCRLWNKKDNKKLDKDIFRQDLGDVKSAYEEVYGRIKAKI